MPRIHTLIEHLAKLLEVAGVFIILAGVLLATLIFLRQGTKGGNWRTSYDSYRANLGRGILLGLELLVGADIIGTITSPQTHTLLPREGGGLSRFKPTQRSA